MHNMRDTGNTWRDAFCAYVERTVVSAEGNGSRQVPIGQDSLAKEKAA